MTLPSPAVPENDGRPCAPLSNPSPDVWSALAGTLDLLLAYSREDPEFRPAVVTLDDGREILGSAREGRYGVLHFHDDTPEPEAPKHDPNRPTWENRKQHEEWAARVNLQRATACQTFAPGRWVEVRWLLDPECDDPDYRDEDLFRDEEPDARVEP